MATPKHIIVHHTAVSYDRNPNQFNATNEYHRTTFGVISKLGFYVGYQYEISKDGVVRQARLDDEEGVHTKGKNFDSIGICLDGNFDVELPTEAQKQALKKLILQKMAHYGIPKENVVPHRTYCGVPPYKSCYGNKLSDKWAQELLGPTREEIKQQIKNLIDLL